jgi:hypothetical protein
MREIQASEAKTHPPRLLDEVDRAIADIEKFRKTMPRISL